MFLIIPEAIYLSYTLDGHLLFQFTKRIIVSSYLVFLNLQPAFWSWSATLELLDFSEIMQKAPLTKL